MAKQTGIIKFTGNLGPVTGYKVDGEYFVKEKGSVSKHRYLNSPEFEKSRRNASVFARAVKLAKVVYDNLPNHLRHHKKVWHPLRNRTQELLRQGMEESQVLETISREYGKGVEGSRIGRKTSSYELHVEHNSTVTGYRQLQERIIEHTVAIRSLLEAMRLREVKEEEVIC